MSFKFPFFFCTNNKINNWQVTNESGNKNETDEIVRIDETGDVLFYFTLLHCS